MASWPTFLLMLHGDGLSLTVSLKALGKLEVEDEIFAPGRPQILNLKCYGKM